MPTRNINLTERYDAFLTRQVESGRFKNTSEAVRAALHLLERQELEEEAKLEALRQAANVGEDAYRRGDYALVLDDEALDSLFVDIAQEVGKG